MKKKLVMFLCVVLSATMLLACGEESGSSKDSDKTSESRKSDKFDAKEFKKLDDDEKWEYLEEHIESMSKDDFLDFLDVMYEEAKAECVDEDDLEYLEEQYEDMKEEIEAASDEEFEEYKQSMLKYAEKSKISSDLQYLDTIRTAITTELADPEYIGSNEYTQFADGDYDISEFADEDTLLGKLVIEIMGEAPSADKLKSKEGQKAGEIRVHIVDGYKITVYVPETELMVGPEF